ncbi:MAG TPA: cardiolipin synthase [Verrucomicrobiae bacterium]|jgi:cardiolipin synthase
MLAEIPSAGISLGQWSWLLSALALAAAFAASTHALIYKREPRSAALWTVIIWLLPTIGPILYLFLGINRVRRRAIVLREDMVRHQSASKLTAQTVVLESDDEATETPKPLSNLAALVERVTQRPLLAGNQIDPLMNGDEIYPAMLKAIEGAQRSIALASYIFDGTGVGARFVEALDRARRRGVAVRVLIDDVYVRFSRRSACKPLRRLGVPVGIFNPPLVPARLQAAHLRNHRKLLIVDGHTGFTGGANIFEPYWRPESPEAAQRDLHFCIRGPVVRHLTEVFVDDWQFATGEALRDEKWFPELDPLGDMAARGFEAGPDESLDRLRWVFIGGINAAHRTIRVWTPYFVPDTALIAALNAAALRGVEVDILLPERSDHASVQWAATAQLWQILEHGCRVWRNSGPFDHSKLFLVDGAWATFGSANWDARSLRLNFEFNVECYNRRFVSRLESIFLRRRAAARQVTLQEVNARPLGVKLRDGAARLFAPYL